MKLSKGHKVSTNFVIDDQLTSLDQLYKLHLNKQSVYHKLWGIKPAAVLLRMTALVIAEAISSGMLYTIVKSDHIGTGNKPKWLQSGKGSYMSIVDRFNAAQNVTNLDVYTDGDDIVAECNIHGFPERFVYIKPAKEIVDIIIEKYSLDHSIESLTDKARQYALKKLYMSVRHLLTGAESEGAIYN